MAEAEKVSQRAFDGGSFLAIPIETQHQIAVDKAVALACFIGYGHPQVLNDAGAANVGQGDGGAGWNRDTGRALTGCPQFFAGGHPTASLFAVWVFCRNGAGAGVNQHRQCG